MLDLKGDAIVRLIDSVEKATGWLFHPLNEQRKISSVAINEYIASIEKDDSLDPFMKAVKKDRARKDIRQYIKKTQILEKAIPQIEENAQPDNVDSEWYESFFDKAETISDDELQNIWAKILSSEVNAPGTINRRLLNALYLMDAEEAGAFRDICYMAINNNPFIFRGEPHRNYVHFILTDDFMNISESDLWFSMYHSLSLLHILCTYLKKGNPSTKVISDIEDLFEKGRYPLFLHDIISDNSLSINAKADVIIDKIDLFQPAFSKIRDMQIRVNKALDALKEIGLIEEDSETDIRKLSENENTDQSKGSFEINDFFTYRDFAYAGINYSIESVYSLNYEINLHGLSWSRLLDHIDGKELERFNTYMSKCNFTKSGYKLFKLIEKTIQWDNDYILVLSQILFENHYIILEKGASQVQVSDGE